MKLATKTLDMSKTDAIDILTGDKYTHILSQFSDDQWGDASGYTPVVAKDLSKAQLLSGEKFKGYEDTMRGIKTMKTLYTLSNEFESVSTEDYNGGAINKVVNEFSKQATGEDWANTTVAEKRKLLKTIAMKSKVGMATSQILNSISGTAVSDSEFERIMGILTGGDIDLNNPRVVAEALRASGDTISGENKTSIQGIRSKYSPYDKMKLVKMYNSGNIPAIGTPLEKPAEGKGTDLKTTAAKVIADEAKQAKELGKSTYQQWTGGNDKEPTLDEGNLWDQSKKWVSGLFSDVIPESTNPKASPYKTMSDAEFKAIDKSKLTGDDKKLFVKEWVRRYKKGNK